MKTIRYLLPAFVSGALLAILVSCRATIPKGARAIKPFDTQKYLGTWYEIARLDYRFEKNLDRVTATYSLKENGNIKVHNKGFDTTAGTWKESIGVAKPAGDAKEGRLKVSFFWPFYSGYNVLAVDKDYTYALVAGRNTKYLWLLSRSKTMPDEVKKEYLQIARNAGYRTEDLVWVNQAVH